MSTTIITSAHPTPVNGNFWFSVRPLTHEDVEWAPWHFPQTLELGDKVHYSRVSAICQGTLTASAIDLAPFPSELGAAFLRDLFPPKNPVHIYACIDIAIDRTGIRQIQQARKFNSCIDQLRQDVDRDGQKAKDAALAALNTKVEAYAQRHRDTYRVDFVHVFSSIGGYDLGALDVESGTAGLLAEIKELQARLTEKEAAVHQMRHACIVREWSGDNTGYPQEPVIALRAELAKAPVKQARVRMLWSA